jgi:PDZ domain-containing protein
MPRWVWLVVPISLLSLVAVIAAFVGLPYYTIAPGSARSVAGLVKVDGAQTYPPQGKVLFTTVSVGPVRNVYQAVDGWLDPSVDVISKDRITGGKSTRQYQQESLQDMVDSKQEAEVVALRKLGYNVAEHGQGAVVVAVRPDLNPGAKALAVGDVVVAVDGAPVALASDLVGIIQRHKPGDQLRLSVRSGDLTSPPHDVTVGVGRRKDGTPLLGVNLATLHAGFDFPLKVDIDSGDVGGPSAGLAFTLALLDVLTPGELTGGVPVAATGTIDSDGVVGPIGGMAQKVVTVRRAGAKVFLVPSEEYAEAKAHAGSLRIEKVHTIDDALAALSRIKGSNALALGRPGGAPQ